MDPRTFSHEPSVLRDDLLAPVNAAQMFAKWVGRIGILRAFLDYKDIGDRGSALPIIQFGRDHVYGRNIAEAPTDKYLFAAAEHIIQHRLPQAQKTLNDALAQVAPAQRNRGFIAWLTLNSYVPAVTIDESLYNTLLGLLLLETEEPEKAILAFQAAKEVENFNPLTNYGLARAYLEIGDRQNAGKYARLASRYAPTSKSIDALLDRIADASVHR